MITATHQVFDDFKAYIVKKGELYRNWYVGTAEDGRHSLFVEHNVSEIQDAWIFRKCSNSRSAKNVKETLLTLGCDGASGGWGQSAHTVFAYLKSSNTTP